MRYFSPRISLLLTLIVTTSAALGAGSIVVNTNGSGVFQATGLGTGSWTGDGTVGTNVGAETGENATIVSGASSGGVLSVGNFAINAGDPATYINGDKNNTGISLNISITATGTNASFDIIGGSNRAFPDGQRWQNFQIENMNNVETLSVTYTFGAPIASVRATGSAPYLVGIRRATGSNTYIATGTIANLTVDGIAYDNSNFPAADFLEIGNAIWDNSTGIGSINDSTGTWNGLGRVDLDGGGLSAPTNGSVVDGNVDEIERTYATGMTWDVERSGGGAFDSGTAFYFSFNGVQYEDTYATVPEPSVIVSLFTACLLLITRRKRS